MSLRPFEHRQSLQHTVVLLATHVVMVMLICLSPHFRTICVPVTLPHDVDPCQLPISTHVAFSHAGCQCAAQLPMRFQWNTASTLIVTLPLIDPPHFTTLFLPNDPPPRA